MSQFQTSTDSWVKWEGIEGSKVGEIKTPSPPIPMTVGRIRRAKERCCATPYCQITLVLRWKRSLYLAPGTLWWRTNVLTVVLEWSPLFWDGIAFIMQDMRYHFPYLLGYSCLFQCIHSFRSSVKKFTCSVTQPTFLFICCWGTEGLLLN